VYNHPVRADVAIDEPIHLRDDREVLVGRLRALGLRFFAPRLGKGKPYFENTGKYQI